MDAYPYYFEADEVTGADAYQQVPYTCSCPEGFTSKTEVDLGRTIEERLKKWSDKPQSKWHSKDPIKTSLSKRAQLRLGEDKGWKKCSYCEENSIPGADTHKFADCPHRQTKVLFKPLTHPTFCY